MLLLVVVVVVDSLMETPILQDTKFLPFFPSPNSSLPR
jgi:hypothetical protein